MGITLGHKYRWHATTIVVSRFQTRRAIGQLGITLVNGFLNVQIKKILHYCKLSLLLLLSNKFR